MQRLFFASNDGYFAGEIGCPDSIKPEDYSTVLGYTNITSTPIRKTERNEVAIFNPDIKSWDYKILHDIHIEESALTVFDNSINISFQNPQSLLPIFFDKIFEKYKDTRTVTKNRVNHETITVCIPCYLKSMYVKETIQSILDQTRMPEVIHVLLMDDDSKKLHDEIASMSDLIVVEDAEKMTIPVVRNYFEKHCITTDIFHIDADDVASPNCLELLATSDSYIVLPKSIMWSRNPDGSEIENLTEQSASLLQSFFKTNVTGLYNLEACHALGGFDESFDTGCEDMDYRIRAYQSEYSISEVKDATFKFRRDITSKTFVDSAASITNMAYKGECYLINKHKEFFKKVFIDVNDKVEAYYRCVIQIFMYAISLNDPENDYWDYAFSYMSFISNPSSHMRLYNLKSVEDMDISRTIYSRGYHVLRSFRHVTSLMQTWILSNYQIDLSVKDITSDISVCIPCYNHANHIVGCVKSFLPDIEYLREIVVLLMDDASIAKTDELLALSTKVRVIKSEKKFPASARNMLIDQSIGDWVFFIDADDYIAEKTIQNHFIGESGPVRLLAHPDVNWVTQTSPLMDKMFITNSSGCYHRSVFTTVGKYDTDFDLGCEDFDLIIRCIQKVNVSITKVGLTASFKTSDHAMSMTALHTLKIDKLLSKHNQFFRYAAEYFKKYRMYYGPSLQLGDYIIAILDKYPEACKILFDSVDLDKVYIGNQ